MNTVQVLYCIPNHNHGRFLKELFASVEADAANGTFRAEILLLNDGCTDGSADEARRYGESGGLPIHVLTTSAASGEGAARSALLTGAHAYADVDFLRCVDADDVIPCGSTVAMIRLARARNLSAVSGQFQLFGDESGVLEKLPLENDEIVAQLRHSNPFRMACALLDASQARAHHLDVDPKWAISADYALLLELCRYGRIGSLPSTVLYYRRHPESVSARNAKAVSKTFLTIVLRNWKSPVFAPPTVRDMVALLRIAVLVAAPGRVIALFVAGKKRVRKLRVRRPINH